MSDRPKICAHCGKLMGVARECPYCGTDNSTLRSKMVRMTADGEGADALTFTMVVLAVNVALYGACLLVGGTAEGQAFDFFAPDVAVVFRLGLQYNPAIEAGAWWRLVMPIFLHLGMLHLIFNCYLLHFAGRMIEEEMGARLMVVIYMASGLAGTLASYGFDIGGAGASGAVMGLLGCILTRRRLIDGNFSHPISRQLLFLIGINVLFGLYMGDRINHAAHGAGFVCGCLITWAITTKPIGRVGAIVVMLSSWGALLLTVFAFLMMGRSLLHGGPGDFRQANQCWNEVTGVVVGHFTPEGAQGALRCLAEVPSLEPEANEAKELAQKSLGRAHEAFDTGDTVGQAQALRSATLALAAHRAWEKEAAPRYGLAIR